MEEEKRYPKGHFIGMGLAIGIPIGVPIGLALGNIALGPAMGLPLGMVLGIAMEKKYNKNPIESTEEEKTKKKKMCLVGILIGLIFFIGIVLAYFFMK
jgi:predicted MFS family arabinose efflux permease